MLQSATCSNATMTCDMEVPAATSPQLSYLMDHVIQGTSIMPGAGMLETASATCISLLGFFEQKTHIVCLRGVTIPAPVVLGKTHTLRCAVDYTTGSVQLRTTQNSAPARVHFTASIEAAVHADTAHALLKHTTSVSPGSGVLLRSLTRVRSVPSGREGPYLRCLASVHHAPTIDGFMGHPAIMDNVLQLGPATGDVGKEDDVDATRVVAGMDVFILGDTTMRNLKGSTPTSTERAPMAENGTIFTNHWLLGGEYHMHVRNLQAKVINLGGVRGTSLEAEDRSRLLYAVEWQTCDVMAAQSSMEQQAASVINQLPKLVATQRGGDHDAFKRPFAVAVRTGRNRSHAAASTCLSQVSFVQSFATSITGRGWEMQLRSHGAGAMSQTSPGASQRRSATHASALSMQSFVRVASTEYPNVSWTCQDTSSSQTAGSEEYSVSQVDLYGRAGVANSWSTPRLLGRQPPLMDWKGCSLGSAAMVGDHLSGSILVTGGLGALGVLVAAWLARLGFSVGSLWLLGRSGRTSGDPLPRSLYEARGQIVCAKGDVSSSEEATDVVRYAGRASEAPLQSIMHAGAVLDSKVISNVSTRSIRTEYSGKVFGADALEAQSMPVPLRVTQLFSSLASFSGAAGQATYAAANGVLDAWAQEAQASGRPVVAVQWGNWGGGGMAVANKGFIDRMERMGLGILEPWTGLEIMARLLGETAGPTAALQRPVQVANIFLWDNIVKTMTAVPPFLKEFDRTAAIKQGQSVANTSIRPLQQIRSRDRKRRGGPERRRQHAPVQHKIDTDVVDIVLDRIVTVLSNLTGGPASKEQPFMDSGLDSLGAVQLRNELAGAFAVELSPTVTFDHPSPAALASHIAAHMPAHGSGVDKIVTELPAALEGTVVKTIPLEPRNVLSDVMSVIESVIGSVIGPDDPLMASGLDSLGAVQLRTAIGERFGVDLPPTAALDFPTASALSKHIEGMVGTADVDPRVISMRLSMNGDEVEAVNFSGTTWVVGLSCAYPGLATEDSVQGFWHTAIMGEDLPSTIPPGRWDIDLLYTPDGAIERMYVRFAAFLPEIECFDASLFRISPAEAAVMDPQGRLLLEQMRQAVSDVGLRQGTLSNQVGVYVGVMHMEFIQYLASRGMRVTPAVTTGNGMDFLIGRVSYTFGFTGPCLSTHTACSSSLVATHLAHTGLLNHEASAAASAGVFAVMYSGTMAGISQLQAFSPTGRCQTFEASADGYGRGEGCAVIMLQPECPDETSNPPLAILQSSAVNQAGRAASLTAPNGPAQSALVVSALQNMDARPEDVRVVALHGTGTPLGDPIETGALGQALSRATTGAQGHTNGLTVLSVKSCYGHTEGAAGLTGAILAIQAATHQVIHVCSVSICRRDFIK